MVKGIPETNTQHTTFRVIPGSWGPLWGGLPGIQSFEMTGERWNRTRDRIGRISRIFVRWEGEKAQSHRIVSQIKSNITPNPAGHSVRLC